MKYFINVVVLLFLLNFDLAKACPTTEVKGIIKWTKADRNHLKRAKIGCKKYYGSNYCLVKFERIGYNRYHAVCGVRP